MLRIRRDLAPVPETDVRRGWEELGLGLGQYRKVAPPRPCILPLMNLIVRALFLPTTFGACGSTDSPTPSAESVSQASAGDAATGGPDRLSVTSAMVFIPKWTGAEGFSAGGKYVISSGGSSARTVPRLRTVTS